MDAQASPLQPNRSSHGGNNLRRGFRHFIDLCRVRTPTGKPGKYWNLIIRFPGHEYCNCVKGPGTFWHVTLFLVRVFYHVYSCDAPTLLLTHNHCNVCVIILLIICINIVKNMN